MKPRSSRLISVLAPVLLGLAGVLAGCAQAGPATTTAATAATPTPTAPAATDTERLRAELAQAMGPARCSQSSQCRSLGVGARPCGGPSAWLAYADRPGLLARLQPLAQALARAEQAEHERSGRMGICQVLPDPGAVCEAGQCVPGRRGASPGGAAVQ